MQQRQFGGGGAAPEKKKGGAKDFLALVGSARMGSAVIPAGEAFPASLTDVTGMTGSASNGAKTGTAS
jgi:hypothetical protein